jgi:hypothetical protein
MKNKIDKIFFYRDGNVPDIDIDKLKNDLSEYGFDVSINGDIFSSLNSDLIEKYAEMFAKSRVLQANSRSLNDNPLYGEIKYEKNRIQVTSSSAGILYDALELSYIYIEIIKKELLKKNILHIIFTNRLFGNWEESDLKYHARVSLYSVIHLISSSGLIEAPARDREYYLLKFQFDELGDYSDIEEKNSDKRWLEYGDKRINDAVLNYVFQAIFFQMFGEPFCKDKNCCLYNAHWQIEIINIIDNKERKFCDKHNIFKKVK